MSSMPKNISDAQRTKKLMELSRSEEICLKHEFRIINEEKTHSFSDRIN